MTGAVVWMMNHSGESFNKNIFWAPTLCRALFLAAENIGMQAEVQVLALQDFSFRWDERVHGWNWKTVWDYFCDPSREMEGVNSNGSDEKGREGMVRLQSLAREFKGGRDDRIWWLMECEDSGKSSCSDLFSGIRYSIGCQIPVNS